METRLNYYQASPKTVDGLSAFSDLLQSSFSDHKLKVLVELRVSQINGCAFCVDLHSHQAREQGEKQQRLDTLSVWREVTFFTEREQAALDWAEAVTLVSESRVPDDVYERAKKAFSEAELVQLTGIIAAMNAWNRFSISFRKPVAQRTGA